MLGRTVELPFVPFPGLIFDDLKAIRESWQPIRIVSWRCQDNMFLVDLARNGTVFESMSDALEEYGAGWEEIPSPSEVDAAFASV
jgi:hypothetical protein